MLLLLLVRFWIILNIFFGINEKPTLYIKHEYYENNFTFFEKLGFDLGERIYFDQAGNSVELTEKESESGIGCINQDDDYDSTYTKGLKDCDENELKLIIDYYHYDNDVVIYAKEALTNN